jgi:hypothetical protein
MLLQKWLRNGKTDRTIEKAMELVNNLFDEWVSQRGDEHSGWRGDLLMKIYLEKDARDY